MYFRNGAILPATYVDGFKGLIYNGKGYFELKDISIPDLDNNVEAQKSLDCAEVYLKYCLARHIISVLRLDSINFDTDDNDGKVFTTLVDSVQELVNCMLENSITTISEEHLIKQLNKNINTRLVDLVGNQYKDLLVGLTNTNFNLLFYPRVFKDDFIILGVNSSETNSKEVKSLLGKTHQLGYVKSSYIDTYADKNRKNTMIILGLDNVKNSYLDDELYGYYVSNCYENSWVDYSLTLENIIIE